MKLKGLWVYRQRLIKKIASQPAAKCGAPTNFVTALLLVLICLLSTKKVLAQDSLPKNTFSPGLQLYLGYIPKTYPIAPQSRYATLASISLLWQFNGRDQWHQHYHYPKGGLELFYGSFDNPAELGYSIGLVPTFEIGSKKSDKKWRARFGLGAAYFSKKYDAVSNTQNYYIGAHFTNMTTIGFLVQNKMSSDYTVDYGASLVHYSDGHTALPNVGLNLLMFQARITRSSATAKMKHKIEKQSNQLSYAVKAGLGKHQFGATEKAVGGPTYPSYHLSSWVSKGWRQIHLLQAGMTIAYYSSFYDYITSQEVAFKNDRIAASTGLIFAGHEFVFGKLSLSTQAGFYFYNPFFIKQKKIEGTWDHFSEKLAAFNSNRVGMIYYPFKKSNSLNNVKHQLMLGISIKANLAQADLFEYSVGYVF
jgi:hypothetical protein